MRRSIFNSMAALFIGAALFTGCDIVDPAQEVELGEEVYVITVSPQGGGDAVINLTSVVTSGDQNIGQAYEGYNFFGAQKIGNALYVANDGGFYEKYSMLGNTLEKVAEISIIEGRNIMDMGNGKLLTYNSADENVPVGYDVIDLATFRVVKSGGFILPKYSDTLRHDITAAYPYGGKIYCSYSLYGPVSEEYIDTAYVAIFDAETFAFEKVIKDSRAQGLGSQEDIKAYTDGGFIYFASQSRDLKNTDIPHCVLRIDTSTDEFDQSYYFNLGDQFNRNLFLYNVHNLGGGKAIALSYDPAITDDYIYQYWLIDINNETANLLDVPAAKNLWWRYMLDISGDKVAMATNSAIGNFIYTYDKATGTVSKGMEYIGGTVGELTGPLTLE